MGGGATDLGSDFFLCLKGQKKKKKSRKDKRWEMLMRCWEAHFFLISV